MSRDCLLWVDGPYRTVAAFLKEAEKRGCCRRMRGWPDWVEPGKTRIFLAHRNDHVRTDFGSIFGFFTLAGVGIVGGAGSVGGQRKRSERSRPNRPSGGSSSDPRPPGGGPGGGRPGEYEIEPGQILLESARLCGKRSEEGAVYFVDSLAHAIDRTFSRTLQDRRGESPAAPGGGRLESEEEFRQAVRQSAPRPVPAEPMPEDLEEHVHPDGALSVLEPPYPSFQRIPQAAFRNLLAVDGETLLKRIAAAYRRPSNRRVRLPYHRPASRGKRKTKGQLIADLAEQMQTSKEFAGELWDGFGAMIGTELTKRQWMTLTGVGTFKLIEDDEGSKRVRFEPGKGLKRRIGME